MTQAASTEDSQPNNPPQTTLQQQPAQPSTQPSGGHGPGPGREILDALNALPERIVNGMREAMQPPRQASPPASAPPATAANSPQSNNSPQSGAASSSTKDTPATPGKKTFAEWWFKG